MYTHIWQNSYIALLISFVVLCLVFYFMEIGYTTEVKPDGTVTKNFSWKYPLAISLIIWIIWHFYLYPPHDELVVETPSQPDVVQYVNQPSPQIAILPAKEINAQKISLINWN